ncbi:hypothetical protein J1614_006990 [Plenodomus biglobosus]|nr:hypothetical protein J1614_006990 [Plenodomus biglobosus]
MVIARCRQSGSRLHFDYPWYEKADPAHTGTFLLLSHQEQQLPSSPGSFLTSLLYSSISSTTEQYLSTRFYVNDKMPAKKEGVETLLKGFEDRETKLIAAAFLSATGPDRFDFDLMATLTGNTVGSLKKMWPPVKRKVMNDYEGFAKFLGQAGTTTTPPKRSPTDANDAKTAPAKKRKVASDDEGPEDNAKADATEPATATDKLNDSKGEPKKKGPPKEKKAPVAKKQGRPRKTVKKESDDEIVDEAAGNGDAIDNDAAAEADED